MGCFVIGLFLLYLIEKPKKPPKPPKSSEKPTIWYPIKK